MNSPVSSKQSLTNTPLAAFDRSGLSEDETAAFVYPDEVKQFLYDIDSIISVKSYDGETVYEYGRDYILKNGKIALTGNSAIPVMTPEVYYSDGEQPILKVLKPDGTESPCYFNGSGTLSKYQIRVTYKHNDRRDILPPCNGRYRRFLRLLENGEDVTVFFHGDSITYGCDASLRHSLPPYQPSFPILFVCALARIYDCSVRFVLPEAEKAYEGPFPEAPGGNKGTITLVNTAVGGWTSEGGVKALETHFTPHIKKYGCDLFILGYGMNDGGRSPGEAAANCEKIAKHVLSLSEGASVMFISTMLPNPDALHGWNANQAVQEPELVRVADRLNGEGVPCDVAKMTSVSAEILKRKKFIDITGNNINHPNDYLSRVYAVTLMQTLIGYDAEKGTVHGVQI
ncbi:MAG: SGNH/GDSL hydrolase family protein [Clostridia bacterium]|nr:SGNH/GDSL hydrolase family protein [Clostridia bacterium]